LMVRQSAPPVQPILDPSPVSRGVSTSMGRDGDLFGDRNQQQPPARLGDPIPLNTVAPMTVLPTQAAISMNRPRGSPPPVILFPPEPLPLR